MFRNRMICWLGLVALGVVWETASGGAETNGPDVLAGHPRLYFSAAELPGLRAKRESGAAARIWANVVASAEWCRDQKPRSEWTPTLADDPLYPRLSELERTEIRETILAVGRAYFVFFQEPLTAGEGYNKHHGSVDAAPFGIMALALLSESPEVTAWLELAIKKHVDYLLSHALTSSGTSDQTSNFWASTLQYRIFFMDSLRRVTGRDLFGSFRNRCRDGSRWRRNRKRRVEKRAVSYQLSATGKGPRRWVGLIQQ